MPGPPGPQGPQGSNGQNGVGISTVFLDHGTGNLVIMMTDGSSYIVGPVIGPPGLQGPPGADGADGADDNQCAYKVISNDYTISEHDQYLGVLADEPVTITLPAIDEHKCKTYIIKCETGAPIGNRKITIVAGGGCLIDGSAQVILKKSYGCIWLTWHNGSWRVTSRV